MRKIFYLLVLLFIFSKEVKAQRIYGVGATNILNRTKVFAEQGINGKWSAGVYLTGYYAVLGNFLGNTNGFRVEPFVRYSFQKSFTEGWYVSGRIYYSSLHLTELPFIEMMNEVGVVSTVGYQFKYDQDYIFDIYFGGRVSSMLFADLNHNEYLHTMYGITQGVSFPLVLGVTAAKIFKEPKSIKVLVDPTTF